MTRLRALVVAVAFSYAAPAVAGDPVDLELLLAVDVSRSIDIDEARFQRRSYVAALRDPVFLGAVETGPLGRIAVAYVEWSGRGQTREISGWSIISDVKSANAFADRLAAAPIGRGQWTSISGVIDLAVLSFDHNDFQGARRVLDISGDGPNNVGGLVSLARDGAVAGGVTINGLPIMDGPPSQLGIEDLDLYYENCVIGGPGAFIVAAEGPQAFAGAIRRKLILEVAGRTPPARVWRATGRRWTDAPPCDIGERLRDLYVRPLLR